MTVLFITDRAGRGKNGNGKIVRNDRGKYDGMLIGNNMIPAAAEGVGGCGTGVSLGLHITGLGGMLSSLRTPLWTRLPNSARFDRTIFGGI
jgi:hypothetical protein